MLRFRVAVPVWAVSSLIACGNKSPTVITECGKGMGRADDGICYPLAGYADDGTTAPTEDSGAGGDGSSGDGASGSGDGSSGDGSGDGSGGTGDGSGGNSDGETGTSSGVSIEISGVIVFDASTSSAANCNISSWVAEAVNEETGLPDRSEYSETDLQFIDCADHGGGALEYSTSILVDDATDVAFYAFIDPDGDASTTDYRAAADTNPMTVTGGESYTEIDFTVSEDGR